MMTSLGDLPVFSASAIRRANTGASSGYRVLAIELAAHGVRKVALISHVGVLDAVVAALVLKAFSRIPLG